MSQSQVDPVTAIEVKTLTLSPSKHEPPAVWGCKREVARSVIAVGPARIDGYRPIATVVLSIEYVLSHSEELSTFFYTIIL